MSTRTGFHEENTISHDGAENRVEYEEQDVEELPQSVEILETGADINHSQVGYGFRDRYQFDALAAGNEGVYELELTATEDGNSDYNVRATYAEDESQVFFGQIEEVEDIADKLNGQELERRY